jgi:hypothetical protein
VLALGAVGQRLVEAAVLGLGHPVGAERHLVERLLRAGGCAKDARESRRENDAMSASFLRQVRNADF